MQELEIVRFVYLCKIVNSRIVCKWCFTLWYLLTGAHCAGVGYDGDTFTFLEASNRSQQRNCAAYFVNTRLHFRLSRVVVVRYTLRRLNVRMIGLHGAP